MKNLLLVSLLAGALLAAPHRSYAQHGGLDVSFNPGSGASSALTATAIQPNGKIIIGSSFSSYNGTTRNGVARLNADGSLDNTFDPGSGLNGGGIADNGIAIQSDGKIIIGGGFTSYNGTTRNRIARLNADGSLDSDFTTGSGANNTIQTVRLQPDGKLVIGGYFSSYNGTARSRIARLNADGSLDNTFDPGSGANSTILITALQPDGKIIIGGDFSSYNGATRSRVARLNTDGSLDNTFDPGSGASSRIATIALQPDGKIIIGGTFSSYNGVSIKCIARLNPDGSLDNTFNPGSGTGSVYASALQPDGKIIIGGQFTSYNGTTRNRIARINTNGSIDNSFFSFPGANEGLWSIALQSDGNVIIVGYFTAYGGVARNYVARVLGGWLITGAITGPLCAGSTVQVPYTAAGAFSPGNTFTAQLSDATGSFASPVVIGSVVGNTSGSITATIPPATPSGAGYRIRVVSSNPAITGSDNGAGIAIETSTTWYADADGDGAGDPDNPVQACEQPIGHVANATDCDDTDPDLYPGALDAGFGVVPGLNGAMVQDMAVYPPGAVPHVGKVVVGGAFSAHGGTPRNNIARLNADGTLDLDFDPGTGANSVVSGVALQPDGRVVIGGSFTEYNGTARNRMARLNADGTLDATFDPGSGTNQPVLVVLVQPDGRILIGGQFTNYNGTPRSRIARLNADGTLDTSFNPGTGAGGLSVDAIALQADGKILIGGSFATYNGVSRRGIARLNADGGLDTTFDPGTGVNAGGSVYAVTVQADGKVLVGGSFTNYNGTARNNIARLNADGSLDATFDPGSAFTGSSGAMVRAIALQADGRILAGGDFDTYNGTTRSRIARLNDNGSLDTGFNPGLGTNSAVWALAVRPNGRVLIGGGFASYNGTARHRVAQVHADCIVVPVYDCPHTEANIDDPCDDGDANTENDVVVAGCTCVGTPIVTCTENVTVELRTDANSAQASWQILAQHSDEVLCQYAVPVNNITTPITENCCLPAGCYRLRVLDSGGDGFVTGGYQLRESGSNGRRIIDNFGNFNTGSTSAIGAAYENGAFCLPVGDDKLIHSSCDKVDWTANKFIVVAENPAVSAQFGVSNATSGYEFWFYDPNGTYSFRRFRSHATSDGTGTGALRANHFKVNGWTNSLATPHLPNNVLLNVRVRGRVAGENLPFGQACLFKLDATLAACPRVKLQDDPANTADFSCGVTRNFGGSSHPNNRITANPPQPIPTVASSSVRYQFRFRIPGEGICIVRPPQTSARLVLNWTNGPALECSKTYEVDVRVSLNGGSTWCSGPAGTGQAAACADTGEWGKVCNVTINACAQPNGGGNSMALEGGNTFTLYPNPNGGEQLFLSITGVEPSTSTATVDIYDLTGKRVVARTIAVTDGFVKTNIELDNALSNGVYVVHITAGTKTHTERLVIAR